MKRWPLVVGLFVPLTLFLWTGNRGVDFGPHWDQQLLITNIRQSLETRTFLPRGTHNYDFPAAADGNYEYPSVLYWIGVAQMVPRVVQNIPHPGVKLDAGFVDEKLFSIRLRQTCLGISALSIVWVFWAARQLSRGWIEPTLAACFLAGSYEVAYHSRWAAPDMIMAQFAMACLTACTAAVVRGNRKYLTAAAIFAGLATGTKYPAGLLVVPLLTASLLTRRSVLCEGKSAVAGKMRAVVNAVWQGFWLSCVVAGAFVVTTPGAILQPWNFLAWVRFNRYHYAVVGHYGHTIRNPSAHLRAMLQYLTLVLPSHWPVVSIVIVCFAMIGAVGVAVRSWRVALVLLPLPVLYVCYFSNQIVMIVRNLLVVAPLMALLAAVGAGWLIDGCRRLTRWRPVAVGIVGLVVAGIVCANFGWLVASSNNMTGRANPAWQTAAAVEYLHRHPGLRVFPSDAVAAALGLPVVPAKMSADHRDVILTFAREADDVWWWPANLHDLTIATFGPGEVNFDYYPNWLTNRLVLLDLDTARRVPVSHVERAVRRADLSNRSDRTLLVYLNCGSTKAASANGISIRSLTGQPYPCARDVAIPQPDVLTIQADRTPLQMEITGLDPNRRYRLGWSWWDWNQGHRVESVWTRVDGVDVSLCPPTALPVWPLMVDPKPHPLPRQWPPPAIYRDSVYRNASPVSSDQTVDLPVGSYRDGTCRLSVHGDKAWDIVISGVWVTE